MKDALQISILSSTLSLLPACSGCIVGGDTVGEGNEIVDLLEELLAANDADQAIGFASNPTCDAHFISIGPVDPLDVEAVLPVLRKQGIEKSWKPAHITLYDANLLLHNKKPIQTIELTFEPSDENLLSPSVTE